MEIKNCRNCKRIFNYITGEPLCPKCRDLLEKKFQEVKEYISDNPRDSITEVSEACDISVGQIKRWVREERLSFTEDSLVGLECERCGKMVHSGRFCKECAGGLADAMNNAFRKEMPTSNIRKTGAGKMRFLE